jgi:hypothetical protein
VEWIRTVLINLYAFFAVVPFISFAVFWFIFVLIWKDKKKAIGTAMDITAFFLVGVVAVMFNEIFNSALGFWLILLMFLIAVGLIGNAQNRLKGRVDLQKLLKVIWRIGFLVLSVLYILFLLIGIIQSIFAA